MTTKTSEEGGSFYYYSDVAAHHLTFPVQWKWMVKDCTSSYLEKTGQAVNSVKYSFMLSTLRIQDFRLIIRLSYAHRIPILAPPWHTNQ